MSATIICVRSRTEVWADGAVFLRRPTQLRDKRRPANNDIVAECSEYRSVFVDLFIDVCRSRISRRRSSITSLASGRWREANNCRHSLKQ